MMFNFSRIFELCELVLNDLSAFLMLRMVQWILWIKFRCNSLILDSVEITNRDRNMRFSVKVFPFEFNIEIRGTLNEPNGMNQIISSRTKHNNRMWCSFFSFRLPYVHIEPFLFSQYELRFAIPIQILNTDLYDIYVYRF